MTDTPDEPGHGPDEPDLDDPLTPDDIISKANSSDSQASRLVALAKHTYELIRDFFKLPDGQTFGLVSRVAADDQDRGAGVQR